jgi:SAM-dependent methyltransferase
VGAETWFPAREILAGRAADGAGVGAEDGAEFKAAVYALDPAPIKEGGHINVSPFFAPIRGDGERLPFRDGAFDVVSALDVLEHVPAGRREAVIDEMCRVSADAVLLCAPFQDAAVERAEAVWASELVERYGIEPVQIREHRERGLPGEEAVAEALGRRIPAGAGFYCGTLPYWLFAQVVRGEFFFRRDSARFLEVLDRYFAFPPSPADFERPAYRRFWVCSKRRTKEELEAWVRTLPRRFEAVTGGLMGGEASVPHSDIVREVGDFARKDMVSAVVVSDGDFARLNSCLQHLLAQKVNVDLEVFVWQVGGGRGKGGAGNDAGGEKADFGDWLRERFPGVRLIRADEARGAAEGLLEILPRLRGGYVLLVAENVDLGQDAVGRLYGALLAKAKTEEGILVPRRRRRRYFTMDRVGRHGSPWKFFAGRVPALALRKGDAASEIFVPRNPAKAGRRAGVWAYGECLFFRRREILGRRFLPGRLNKRSVFLWEYSQGPEKIAQND